MHTSNALTSGDFQITADGRPASLAELLPGFDEHTRLGIVVTQDGGGGGASTLGHGPRELVGEDGRPRETFRRLTLDDALGMLATAAQ